MQSKLLNQTAALVLVTAVLVLEFRAFGQPPPKPVDAVLPLNTIFMNSMAKTLAEVHEEARQQAMPNGQPKYKSGRLESKIFEGCFIPAKPTGKKKSVSLAIFSDDGATVEVNGKVIHEGYGKPQHLPYVTVDDIAKDARAKEKDKVSFHVLNGSDGKGAPWQADTAYAIKVTYSNIVFVGQADIDGCTLFAFDGGGTCAEVTLSASTATSLTKQKPGTPIPLNDDYDNGTVAPDPVPDTLEGYRPYEPIEDRDYVQVSPNEKDLVKITLKVAAPAMKGNVILTLNARAQLRFWPRPTKGKPDEIITIPKEGKKYAQKDLPKGGMEFWVEGIGHADAVLTATLQLDGVKGAPCSDFLALKVVRLTAKQKYREVEDEKLVLKERARIIYDYDSDISFSVFAAGVDAAEQNMTLKGFEFRWDLDGNGKRDSEPFEKGVGERVRKIKYAPKEDKNTVQLDPTLANNRKEYEVSVELTGGLILKRKIRVALDKFVGMPLEGKTPKTPQQRQDDIATFAERLPKNLSLTLPGDEKVRYSQDWFVTEFSLLPSPLAKTINNGNRLQYSTKLDGESFAFTIVNASEMEKGKYQNGKDRKVFVTVVTPSLYDQKATREDLSAIIDHEIVHLNQFISIRDNTPKNNAFRLLDDYYGKEGKEPAPRFYVPFLEAQAVQVQSQDKQVGWIHFTNKGLRSLDYFRENYGANDKKGALLLLEDIDKKEPKAAARKLLQDIYQKMYFPEMRQRGYDFSIRPPQ